VNHHPCPACGTQTMTSHVAVLLVFAPGLKRPYPLIPEDEYSVCVNCRATFTFVDRACAGHRVMRLAGPWTRAIFMFDDGSGLDVTVKRQDEQPTQKMASA
jgi:hypothetical protein